MQKRLAEINRVNDIFARNGYTLVIQKGLEEEGDFSAMAGLVNLKHYGLCMHQYYYNKDSDSKMIKALEDIISKVKTGNQSYQTELQKALRDADIEIEEHTLGDLIPDDRPTLEELRKEQGRSTRMGREPK